MSYCSYVCMQVAYADDITLVAPSAGGLQKMLQVCEEFGFE